MTQLFLYIVGAEPNPNRIADCHVPWEVDENEIFFGPCKKRLRALLRENCRLWQDKDMHIPYEDIYIVGVNSSNPSKTRKILWAGRIKNVMTFARAWTTLKGPRYEEMIIAAGSPLHVEPLYDGNRLIGYRHRENGMHPGSEWITDILSSERQLGFQIDNDKISLVEKYPPERDAFPRDACMLLDNIFFAKGSGIDIDETCISILKQAQNRVDDITPYAIFGQKNRRAISHRGYWLPMKDETADKFIDWVVKKRGLAFTA